VNNPPVVNPIPNSLPNSAPNATESFLYSFSLAPFFSDADGDPLTYLVDGLPNSGNLTLDSNSGVISGTPTETDVSDLPLNLAVTVTDNPRSPFTSASIGPLPLSFAIPALDRVDIALSLVATPDPATVDAAVSWSFTITNTTPHVTVQQVDLTAELTGTPFTFTDTGGCVTDGQAFACTGGPIPPESSITLTASGRATQAGDVLMTASVAVSDVTGFEPIDANPTNNSVAEVQNIGESFSTGPAQKLPVSTSQAIAAGDIDGDGYTDLVVATAAGGSTEIYLSTPMISTIDVDPLTDRFRRISSDPMALGDVGNHSTAVLLVDLDGDRDLDLAMANGQVGSPQGNSVFLNESVDGQLILTPIPIGLGNQTSYDVAAADLNGDGFLDLIFANGSPNEIFLNLGGGSFVLAAALGDSDSRAVVVDDFDGDGLPDLLFANFDGSSLAYRGLGEGLFAAGTSLEVGSVTSVQSSDVSGDGRPDVIFGRQTATLPALPSNAIYINTSMVGELSFSSIDAALGTSPTVKVLTDDVSLDGTTDLVALNATGTHQIFVGAGNGAFSLHPEQFLSASTTSGAFGDFNNDGRVDLAVGGLTDLDIFFNDGRGNLGAGDTSIPVIQMAGAPIITLEVGGTYVDASATASDDVDGNITDRIVTVNPVDTAIVGKYSITYNVYDSSGNAATTVVRSVEIAARAGTGGGGGGSLTVLFLGLLSVLIALRRVLRPEEI
jgi:hypothetical protein